MLRFSILSLLGVLTLTGCAATTPETIGPRVDNASTSQLWTAHRDLSLSALQLAYVEAELSSRGETRFGSSYIGQRTASAYGKALYSRVAPASSSSDLKNCSDFSSSWQAQRYFLDNGGPVSDPNNLDRDGDGLACEWGATVRSSVRKATAVRTPVRTRPRYTSRCYVGPRGGTYTISASGRKNYGGC
ncbi:excalibur calcium-binding domain-containing protein [uncultured Tateyamaria sp.]|uniref:excalibur calcium-binding domain-containing protein n=1 Tax=uncultured Tateyamaria sp. TaxID=455651 RepID=UPI00344B2418